MSAEEKNRDCGEFATVAERLRALRDYHRLTQAEFARLVCISRKTLSELETGKKRPSGLLLLGLKSKFGADMEWIIAGKGTMITGCDDGNDSALCRLVRGFSALSTEGRQQVLDFVESLSERKNGIVEEKGSGHS